MTTNMVEKSSNNKDICDDSSDTWFLYKPSKYGKWYRNLVFIGLLNLIMNLYQLNIRRFNDDNLFLGSSLVASSNEVNRITLLMEDELGISISEELVDEYLVLNAIRENRNLNDAERDFFYRYIDMIKDNPFLDKENAYSSLLNFDILRVDRPEYIDDSVCAEYVFSKRDIRLFTDDLEKMSLAHEGVHCLYVSDKTSDLPDYFCEGMTELLTNEYFSDKPYVEFENYPYEISAIKLLCEITSTDTVLKAFSFGDMSYIAADIGSIIGDYEEAVLALDALECCFNNLYAYYAGDGTLDNNDKLSEFCLDVFNQCIDMKYSDDIEKKNDYLMQYELFINMFEDAPYISFYKKINSWQHEKPYFSSVLKNDYYKDKNSDCSDDIHDNDTSCEKTYVKFG